jgi:hypothetical protein
MLRNTWKIPSTNCQVVYRKRKSTPNFYLLYFGRLPPVFKHIEAKNCKRTADFRHLALNQGLAAADVEPHIISSSSSAKYFKESTEVPQTHIYTILAAFLRSSNMLKPKNTGSSQIWDNMALNQGLTTKDVEQDKIHQFFNVTCQVSYRAQKYPKLLFTLFWQTSSGLQTYWSLKIDGQIQFRLLALNHELTIENVVQHIYTSDGTFQV